MRILLIGDIVGSLDTGQSAAIDSRAGLETADGYTWVRVVTGADETWAATDFLKPLTSVPDDAVSSLPGDLASFIDADAAKQAAE